MKIIIPGIPIAKARHKACRRGAFISMYDPQETQKKSTSNYIASQLSASYDINLHSAYLIELLFYCPFPKDYFPWITPHHNSKSDIDNYIKYYLDCSNKILFHDDKQIVEIYAKKLYSNSPRTEIDIMPLEVTEIHPDVQKVLKIFDPDSLSKLVNDVLTLSLYYSMINDATNPPKDRLTAMASLLVSISKQHTEKLNKLKKIADIPCDTLLFKEIPGAHYREIY